MRRPLFTIIALSMLPASFAIGADLLPDPNPVSLSANAGTTVPIKAQVNVNASSGSLNFTAAVSTSSGGQWLSVSPTSAHTPATLTVSANPTGLPAGFYTGFITLSCAAGSSCAAVSIEVDFNLQGVVLTAAPNMVTATVGQGLTQKVNIVLTGSATVSPASNQSWLGAPANVNSPGTLSLTIDATSLTAGKYTATAVLQCVNGTPCLSVTITIVLTVTAPGVSVSCTASEQCTGPPNLALTITGTHNRDTFTGALIVSSSSGTVPFTVAYSTSTGGGWLSGDASGTATPAGATINLAAKSGSFAPNSTYQGTATVTSAGNVVPVVIQFVLQGNQIAAAPNSIAFTVAAGQTSTPDSVVLTYGDLTQKGMLVPSSGFLTVDQNGAFLIAGKTIKVTVAATSLAAGQITGSVLVQCVNDASHTACFDTVIAVKVSITGPAIPVSANPSAVTFVAFQGRGDPKPKTVTVSSSDGSSVPFTVSGAPSWLTVSNTSGSTGQSSGVLTLSPVTSGLPASGASTTLTITPGNSAPAVTVNVVLSFAPFAITAIPNSLSLSVQSGKTQTATLAVSTVDTQPASVNVGVTGSPALTVSSSTLTAPASVTATVDATGVAAGTYAATIGLTCAAANPCASVNVGVQITVSAGPLLPIITTNGVVPIYNTTAAIAPGEWASIYGSNLVTGPSASWNGPFPVPITLAGTSVKIDGKDAPLIYAGPDQINFQVPDDQATGTVPVTVTTANGSTTATVTMAPYAPSFLLLDDKHVAAEIVRGDGSGTHGSYDILGPTGTSLGYQTVAAKAGDVVELFAVGFGPTNPSVPVGQPPPGGNAPAIAVPVITIGGANAVVSYAGVVAVGLYQINVTVPANAGTGDQLLLGSAGGVQSQSAVVFSLQ